MNAASVQLPRIVIIGGGFAGLYCGKALKRAKADVTLIDKRNFHLFQPLLYQVATGGLSPANIAAPLRTIFTQSLGVEVINSARVQEIHPDHVVLSQGSVFSRIETETVLWAAGVKSSPLGKALADAVGGVTVDRAGRVPVEPDCSIAGQPNIFVLGDLASQNGADGKPLPGLAPVAMQQGDYVAHLLMRRMSGETEPGPFKYLDKGTMATIGRSRAVADAHWIKFSGKIAWLAWLFVHIMYLAKFSNRMLVLFQWFWNYITRNRSARLITGDK